MVNLFFSYSHRDEALRDELEIHLASLKRQGVLTTWHDRRIGAGNEFDHSISEHLESADIVLLLISPYFIASDYCFEVEMKGALERHENKHSIVIPVILHPCDWHDMPFGKLLASPTDGKPISKFPNLHDGFLEVTKAVKDNAARICHIAPEKTPILSHQHQTAKPATAHSTRSSNLRIKKSFTDHDKDTFLSEAFEYIANSFEGSLLELKARNPEVDINFRRIDANNFSATIYMNGSEASHCKIWLGDKETFSSGIMYSTGGHGNSYNESLSVEDDGHTMYLKPLGMSFHQLAKNEQLSFEGGAEYYWSMLIQYLQ
jgi:hypothetical protein